MWKPARWTSAAIESAWPTGTCGNHNRPGAADADDVDVAEALGREPARQRVRSGERAQAREDADDLAGRRLYRGPGLLERHLEARLLCLACEGRTVRGLVRAVDLDLVVAAALVLDLDPLEAELSGTTGEGEPL